jgi:hypothetical protein
VDLSEAIRRNRPREKIEQKESSVLKLLIATPREAQLWGFQMLRTMVIALVTLGLAVVGAARAAEQDDAALIKAMSGAKVTLQQGLMAAQRVGQPISAKFEMEDGKLQLSVYVQKNKKISEVIVDYVTGTVAKTEAITEGDDFAAAKSQSAAMAKAKSDLRTAVNKAADANSAVSVVPELKSGRPIAAVVRIKNGKLETASQPLD